MLSQIVKRITFLFVKNQIIKEEDREVYAYGFELLFSTFFSLLAILILSLFFHKVLETAIFLAVFILMRSFAGGYHATDHLRCFLILLFVYGIFLAMHIFVSGSLYILINLCFGLFSTTAIFLLSPVEDKNKPLTKKETAVFRLRSRISSIFYLAVIIIGIAISPENSMLLSVSCGYMTVSVSIIAAYIRKRAYTKRDVEL